MEGHENVGALRAGGRYDADGEMAEVTLTMRSVGIRDHLQHL